MLFNGSATRRRAGAALIEPTRSFFFFSRGTARLFTKDADFRDQGRFFENHWITVHTTLDFRPT